ncbi:hypothetical protein GCM10010435_11420 [Winogradskya consettensis]|uniref:Uncharacterized protein n=1 Tax=Winogradskya consettensis TaxID=113560 RepID=A0A919VX56_9ACTN|nr:hypothetical protein Aco04nite_70040 [Actinoplanes consettensis]
MHAPASLSDARSNYTVYMARASVTLRGQNLCTVRDAPSVTLWYPGSRAVQDPPGITL